MATPYKSWDPTESPPLTAWHFATDALEVPELDFAAAGVTRRDKW